MRLQEETVRTSATISENDQSDIRPASAEGTATDGVHGIVSVVIPVPLEKTFAYRVPEGWDTVEVGTRVLVPFGNRQLTGIVVDDPVDDSIAVSRLKSIVDVLESRPSFSRELLELTKWIADYYVCGWGEVLKAAAPTGVDLESQRVVEYTGQIPVDSLHPTSGALLQEIMRRKSVKVSTLRREFKGFSGSSLQTLERVGLVRIQTVTAEGKVRVKMERRLALASDLQSASIDELVAALPGAKQRAVLETLVGFAEDGDGRPTQTEVLKVSGASSSTVKTLVEKGLVRVDLVEANRAHAGMVATNHHSPNPPTPVYHPSQKLAIETIASAIGKAKNQTFLLHGVTGSGKTEVYIAALKETIARGKTGIILVPEIALTPQTVSRFTAHFGDSVAVLHSRMSLGERFDAWRLLRDGKYSIAIGPRSAVLAPLENIGLIVVDEEHEQSYKQYDPAPRYHARDVAVYRSLVNDAVCILGSATPSLESYVNATAGKYTLLPMRDRVPVEGRDAADLPSVNIVDLTVERKKDTLEGVLSEPLKVAIADRLRKNQQVILLQNRRGYAPVLECEKCGWSPSCPDCSVTMTYHKVRRQLRCHYCGRTDRMHGQCGNCGSSSVSQLGAGTQRVEEELQSLFPDARIARMDLDTTGRKHAHHRILNKFGRRESDILVGTQMVAKGLDFEHVTLVGVVDADTGLLMPDFRSEERTFQLLTQVAGRSGRSTARGEVFLQTRNPKNPAVTYAIKHDYDGFAAYALRSRGELQYPPYGRIVALNFKGVVEQRVSQLATEWTEALIRRADGVSILGPSPAFIARIKKHFRYHTLVKVPRGYGYARLREALRAVRDEMPNPGQGYHVAIDVDAVGLF